MASGSPFELRAYALDHCATTAQSRLYILFSRSKVQKNVGFIGPACFNRSPLWVTVSRGNLAALIGIEERAVSEDWLFGRQNNRCPTITYLKYYTENFKAHDPSHVIDGLLCLFIQYIPIKDVWYSLMEILFWL